MNVVFILENHEKGQNVMWDNMCSCWSPDNFINKIISTMVRYNKDKTSLGRLCRTVREFLFCL